MTTEWTHETQVSSRRAPQLRLHVRPLDADALGGGFADEGGDAMSTVAGETTTAYVVRGSDGHVVVAFWGESAPEEADRWLARDYRVDRVQLPVE